MNDLPSRPLDVSGVGHEPSSRQIKGSSWPRRSMVLPVALIVAGVVLLLGTLGVVPTTTLWSLGRLWPLLLIAWGAEQVLPQSSGWSRNGALGVLAVAVLIGAWLVTRPQATGPATTQTVLFTRPGGSALADVQLGVGVAHLNLMRSSAASGPGTALLSGDVQTLPGERLEQSSRQDGATAIVRLAAQHDGAVSVWPGQGANWTLRLTPDLPLNLTVTTGVGTSDIDLRGVQVRDLKVTVGVGQTDVTLPAAGPLRARLVGGVGALTLRFPPGLPVRVTVTPGVGRVSAGPGLIIREHEYVSATYDAAPSSNRAEVQVTGGVGSVRLDTRP